MSDNSINPVSLASTMAVGAAAGAAAPKAIAAGKKVAPIVREGADKVILATKTAATKTGSNVAEIATKVGKKAQDLTMPAIKKTTDLAANGLSAVKAKIPASVSNAATKTAQTTAKVLKNPMVAAALIAGLAYSVVAKLSDERNF